MFGRWLAMSLCMIALALPAHAGVTGHYSTGADFYENGSLPPPGMYMKNYLINYRASDLKDSSGHKVGGDFKVDTTVLVNRFLYVTDKTVLGADWAVHAVLPIVRADVTTPFGAHGKETGVGDVMIEPMLLGWHGDQWDAVLGLAFYLPTGRWKRDEPANLGKDFYTGMLSTGLTWYADPERTLRFGGRLRYEKHTSNRTLDIHQGDDLTFEWSGSKTLWGVLDVGLAGYAQWQVTRDTGKDVYWGSDRDRIYAAGPEIKLAIPAIQGSLTLNYLKEFGARDHSEGDVWALSFAIGF